MSIVETVPCYYDITRDCPKTCRLHDKAVDYFNNLVEDRNEFLGTNLTPEEVLEALRKDAKINPFPYLYGVEIILNEEPGTHECEQRTDILASFDG